MLTTVKIHEVQNSIVSLLSFVGKIKESSDCTNFLKILGLEHTPPAHQCHENAFVSASRLACWYLQYPQIQQVDSPFDSLTPKKLPLKDHSAFISLSSSRSSS